MVKNKYMDFAKKNILFLQSKSLRFHKKRGDEALTNST